MRGAWSYLIVSSDAQADSLTEQRRWAKQEAAAIANLCYTDDTMSYARIASVYAIVCDENGRIYIGSSLHAKRRLAAHTGLLFRGQHPIKQLQGDWDKYGSFAFTFAFLETIDMARGRFSQEQAWIDNLKPYYNASPTAKNCSGVKHTSETRALWSRQRKGYIHSPESRLRMKEGQRNRSPEAQALRVERLKEHRETWAHSEESRQKISAAQKGKRLTPEHRHRIAEGERAMSPEARARQTAGKVGKTRSEQAKANMKKAQQARRAREAKNAGTSAR